MSGKIIDPAVVPTTKVFGGPHDGTEVLMPPPADRSTAHGIGLPAGLEHQEVASGRGQTWAVYMWVPRQWRYCWVDFFQGRDQDELIKAMRLMAGNVR